MKLKVVSIFASVVLLFSCTKDKSNDPSVQSKGHCNGGSGTYYLDADVAAQKFKLNSYWIYEDSITSQEDSVYVTGAVHEGTSTWVPEPCYNYQIYYYKLQHSLTGIRDCVLLGTSYQYRNVTSFFSPQVWPTYISYSNFSNVDVTFPNSTFIKRDSVFVYDQYYKKVVSAHINYDVAEGGYQTVYYSNSEYGLLRKDVLNSNGSYRSTWRLKRRSLVR